MASPDTPGGAASSTAPDGQSSSLAQMGKELLTQLLPLVVSAGGLAALVFAVGAAVSVARFQAAGLPWEQAVNAATESDMRTIGLMWLVVFGLLGLLGVALAYIASPQGRATAAMYYALIAIATVEAGVVWYAARRGASLDLERMDENDWYAGGVLVGAALAAILVVLAVHVGARRKQLVAARKKERERQARIDGRARARGEAVPERPDEKVEPPPGPPWWKLALLVAVCGLFAALVGALYSLSWYEAVLLGLGVALLFTLVLAGSRLHQQFDQLKLAGEARIEEKKKDDPSIPLPHWAAAVLGLLSLGAGITAALLLGKLWVAPAIVFAGVLGLLTIRVAELCIGFRWYGVSVFFAVCVFGAVVGVLRMLDEPRLQPVAFLMTDGDDVSGVQGVYVGESDDRLWFASIALEDCEDDVVRRGSGRLRSVPLNQASHVSIGPQMGLPSLAYEAKAMLDDIMEEHPGPEEETELVAVRDAVVLDTLGRQRGEAGTWVALEDESGADEGLGGHPTLTLDGRQLPLRRAEGQAGEWQVRLPRRVDSGPIYAACGEKTNKAFLSVRKPPHAVLTARARGDSRWRLNGGASDESGGVIRWYRWEAGGRSLGWGKSITFEIGPARERRVTLAVGDSEGLVGVISVRLRGSFVRAYPADALFCLHCRRVSREGRRRLRTLRERAADASKVAIRVHTDERGNETRNDALSDARAQALKRELRRDLRRPPRVNAKGHGEARPLSTNAHRQNRRVVVVVSPKPARRARQAR